MKTALIGLVLLAAATTAQAQKLAIAQKGDTTIVTVTNPTKYLILPIEEDSTENKVKLDKGLATDTWMDIRLARKKIDYNVPFELGSGKKAVVKILGLKKGDIALKKLKLSNVWNPVNTDYYRPIYHHTPSYGWMNDANGMFYKDGVWNLYYQYNPYGSKWGNMHWGRYQQRSVPLDGRARCYRARHLRPHLLRLLCRRC